ncbi:hypothetical protein HPB48_021296 [Haemaphysalis longicornis]|uniref:Uncharacterized protein n=1 Tax=Haemaphysalis longicornis TaxID=44386 RepID=A0A9J6FNP2_HAELO|nr:hypothetical protein HPB48_021296 [Haemaphysalis longicornis]
MVVNETSCAHCWQRPLYGNVSVTTSPRSSTSPRAPGQVRARARAKTWTEYEYRVYAWNDPRGRHSAAPSTASPPRIDYCLLNVCKHGSCENTGERPGFRCLCEPGFYGEACEHFDPCSHNPCKTFGSCVNTSHGQYRCDCFTGFSGRNCSDFNPCLLKPSACLHGGVCTSNASHMFTCHCVDGYYGKTCHQHDPCFSAPCLHGGRCRNESDVKFACLCSPGYGVYAKKTSTNACPARAKTTAIAKMALTALSATVRRDTEVPYANKESFQTAENITSELEFLTHDPSSIRSDQLQSFADKIEPVVEYAIKDIKIAQAMIHVISNFLALNDSVIEEGDANGIAVEKLVSVVERFAAEVVLGSGALIIENENLVVKANIVITIPFEALSLAINNSLLALGEPFRPIHEVEKGPRIAFVSYRNDKFFRPAQHSRGSLVSAGQVVLSAKIGDTKIENLTEPLVYSYPSYNGEKYTCAFWDDSRKEWSTVGITTNQSGNLTVCSSTHMTAFSLLLDPIPGVATPAYHYRTLSLISHVGCIMSVVGLFFTILTYALFRCLNKERLGKILLNLCLAMLFLNLAFLAGSLHDRFPKLDLCLGSAVATHYFLLACLAWMGVEAMNMYQMLVHVFASSERCFMLKRALIAWGIPAVVVGTCLAIDLEPYRSQEDYCAISSRNTYIYYIAFLGVSCLILFVNLLVFIMVMRVLLKPRMPAAAKSASHTTGSGSQPPITTGQVRGAFTVMTLLGVTWIFGVFAVGDARTVFQYVFCVCNSMQGFLIFVVRVLQYPEARAAWAQLVGTGTFKKHRGSGPPTGSWCANSNPKQNSHSSMVRVTSTSTDSTSTVVFNSNIWSKERNGGAGAVAGARDCPTRLSRLTGVGSLMKNCNLQKGDWNTNACGTSRKKFSKVTEDEPDSRDHKKDCYASLDNVTNLVPDLYAGQEQQPAKSYSANASEPFKYVEDDMRTSPLGFGASQKDHILFAYAAGETVPVQINGYVQSPVVKPTVEPFSTFKRPSPVPTTPNIPELPKSWATKEALPLGVVASDSLPAQNSLTTTTEETSFLTNNGAGTVLVS